MKPASDAFADSLSVMSRMSRLRSNSRAELVAPRHRLAGPGARHRRQVAGHQAHGQQREQRHPVLRIGDRQRADRRQEKEVEGEDRGERGRDRHPERRRRRHQQDDDRGSPSRRSRSSRHRSPRRPDDDGAPSLKTPKIQAAHEHPRRVNDKMQRGYVYLRTEPVGRHFDRRISLPQLRRADAAARRVRRQVHDRLPAASFPRRGSSKAKLVRRAPRSAARTTSASTPRSRSRSGAGTTGCGRRIRAAGFSGTAATTWAAAARTMRGRSRDGGRSRGTPARSASTASRATGECRPRQRQALLHWAVRQPEDLHGGA